MPKIFAAEISRHSRLRSHCGKDGVETVSNLIFNYATCIPNSTVEDAVFRFSKLHKDLDIMPYSTSYENLVSYVCRLNKLETALHVVENMCEAHMVISANILHSLLQAFEQNSAYEFDLVLRICSILNNKNVRPHFETLRRSIDLCLRINHFEGAYNILNIMKKSKLTRKSCVYNSIMAGYFRKKKWESANNVFKEMEKDNVQPDSTTFSYLIYYAKDEKFIEKYYEQMKQLGLQANTQVYMSLIHAYTFNKAFEKAEQVLMKTKVSSRDHNHLKNYLISALARNGKITKAVSMYAEMKKSGCTLEIKTIAALIDNADSNTEVIDLVQLMYGMHDLDCVFKITLFAVRNNKTSCIFDLIKQNNRFLLKMTKSELPQDKRYVEYWFSEVCASIAETEYSLDNVKLGLDLMSFVKEELEFCLPRKCLDFLLQSCVEGNDMENGLVVWEKYKDANLPHSVLDNLRMYQLLVSKGDWEKAEELRAKLPNDEDVNDIIEKSRISC